MIDGVILRMGGDEWIMPPLTVGQLRRLSPKIKELANIQSGMADLEDSQLDAIVEIVTAALTRNYPDMTETRVADELLDLGNFDEVIKAVMSGSGLRLSKPGEAVAVTGLNGATSMDYSPPLADTPTQLLTQ